MSAAEAATQLASTKRPPALSGGKVAAPATYLAGLYIVPLLPVNAETVSTLQLNSPREAKETFIFSPLPDIVEGDLLVVGSTEYVIRSVSEWQRPSAGSYLHLIVEEQK